MILLTEAMEAPIPPPLPDDEEDVSWALSTSNALWGRGERAEALKWLRRAAEHASDVNADARALHLFKAAADISTRLSNPPAPPSVPASASPSASPSQAPARSGSSAPPLPPAAKRTSALMNATLPSATARAMGARLEPAPAPPPRRLPTASKPPLAPRSLQPAAPGQVRVTHARTMQSPDADGLAATIRREPASDAAPRQPAGRGTAPTPQSRSSDSRAPSPDADAQAEPKPVGRRRSTDSGRKKTVDERLKREATQAAASRVRLAPKNERFTAEDEVTQTRSAASLVEAATAAAEALEKYDDLDEDTRVLSGRSSTPESEMSESVEAELDRAVEDLAGAPETVVDHTTEDTEAASATETGFAWSHTTQDGTTPDAPRRPEGSPRHARTAAIGAVSVAVPSTERAAPIPVLAAVRVAVLPGTAPGEARLVVLDGVATPPAGAVHAVLLPLTSADGASILRLLGG